MGAASVTNSRKATSELMRQLKLFEDGVANGDAVVEAALELLIELARGESLGQTAWLLSLVRERFRSEEPRR